MAFTINGSPIPKLPDADGLIEDYVNYETMLTAIDGGKQRTRAGRKKRAQLKWTRVGVSDYQALSTLFDSGSAVAYYNDFITNKPGGLFSFTGLPTFTASSPYSRGTSKLVDITVVIEES